MDKKKIAAAIAAVTAYIKTQEEAAAMQQASMPTDNFAQCKVNLWAIDGRQSQMQMRNLMQMRTFNR